ncbi:MAG: ATP phosphoribosyltransferase regulatory subunit [Clostridia bacterium]|nr:ATP phosphoribosyltransferase regulatory subunit [Clostridia bacterium]
MKNYAKITPEGTKDYLANESRAIRCAEKRLSSVFKSKGYEKVMTPTIEFFDVFNRDSSGYNPEDLYSLTDSYGRLLVLRPDSTLPIARLVSTRFQNARLPLRLYYNQNVFVRQKNLTGRSDEAVQSGIELMGISGLRADLEVITTAVEAIENCTSADFKLEIGHAGFFKELCKKLNVNDETISEIYDCVESRNFVSLNNILDKIGKTPITDSIRNLPRFFGGLEVIEKAKEIGLGDEGEKALNYLKELYELLCDAGLSQKIVIDLSLVNRTNYYTGIIFKGYLQGSGISVVSGGRYDSLGAEFGRDMPSTGFGIETGALAAVMLSRNEIDDEKMPEVIVFGENENIVKALEYSKKLRADGTYCENSAFDTLEETKEYAKSKGIKKICIVEAESVREEIV